jgi:NADH-quinone oxidoreductase subunit L
VVTTTVLLLIPLFPLLGFLLNAFLGRRLPKEVSGGLACLVMLASFAVSVLMAWRIFEAPPEARVIEQTIYMWMSSGDLQIPLTFRLDPLATVMILVVTGIGLLIHVYSTSYMHEEIESEYARYFSYLNLFAFFMLVLVLGANFLVMFVGWEGVGLCSYLLIGFWFKRQAASDAGKKAFVVNRVGDFAFLVGMLLLFRELGTLDFREVALQASVMQPEVGFGVISIATLLFFIGATGKSAQIPLYTWLPDAMEGPTPVSALIHAATMVTAGVYMIGRNAELFALAPGTMEIVAVVGAVTALMAGTIGLVQNDIKRVLAYSTVSQLGFMFLAMGVGAYGAGIFHLYTHAFFKALMFLGSGAVIHALNGEQDMRRMGGLRKDMPLTYWTFLVGALAIAGVPGLAGFFSKDEILFRTFWSGHTTLWALGAMTSLLTATYMFRLVYMTFHGERRTLPADARPLVHDAPRPDHTPAAIGHGHDEAQDVGHGHGPHGRAHDAPLPMAAALVVLALGSVLAGYVGVPHALGGHNRIEQFLEPSFHPAAFATAPAEAVPHGETPAAGHAAAARHGDEAEMVRVERTLMVVSTLIALLGIGIATIFFLKQPERASAIAARFPGLHRLLLNKYYVDEAYDAALVQPIKRTSDRVLWKGIDVGIIDGAVDGTGSVVRGSAALLRLLQTGSVRTYAVSLFLGVLLVLGFYLAQW